MGKRVLGCSFIENFSSHFCGELIIPVHKSSGILGVCAYHCLPHAPDPKGELLVSLPGQVSVAISQSSKEFAFSCKVWQSSCDTSNTKKTTGISRKSQPPWGGHSPEETRKGTHSSLHTIYPKAHNLPSASSVSQLSKLCPTTYPLFGQVADPEKQQRSSSHCREEEARTACKAAPRGKEPLAGHKEGRLRLALERAMQRGLDHRGHEKKR